MPRLSIVVPTRNRSRWLRECVTSLLATRVDCEVVVSDNASDDDTEATMRAFADPRVRYLRQPHDIGAMANYELLLGEAKGDVVCCFGDDDRALPSGIEKKLAILDAHPEVVLVYSLWHQIGSSGAVRGTVRWPGLVDHSYVGGRDEFRDLLVANYIALQTVLVRKSVIAERGGFASDTLRAAQDWDALLRWVKGRPTAFLHEPTAQVRVHEESYTTSVALKAGDFVEDKLTLWHSWLIERPDPPVLGDLHWQWAEQALVADAIAAFGRDEERIRPLVARLEDLRRNYRERMSRVALDCIADAARALAPSVAPPRPAGSAPRLAVRWEGSQFVYHSLGHVNRELCRALLDAGDVDLELVPYEPHEFTPAADSPLHPLAERIGRPLGRSTEVHVRHQWPPRFDAPGEGAWVVVQPWEYGGMPGEWFAPMRDAVDEVWVPSSWVKDGYVKSGLPAEKVAVVPNGVDLSLYRPDGPRAPLRNGKKTRLLFVGGLLPRKGIDLLLEAYLGTFTAADDVCLVIKGFGAETVYRNSPGARLVQEVIDKATDNPTWPAIEYIPETLTDEQMASLYRACDALVAPYRGEGFGMPIAEAMASGLCVVVTGHGACLDFCDESTALLVPAREVPLDSAGLPPNAVGYWWAEPELFALGRLMRRVVDDPSGARALGAKARERIAATLSWERCAAVAQERLAQLAKRRPVREVAPPPFRTDTPPLRLDGRRGVAFLHHPNWRGDSCKRVLTAFAKTFTSADDATLVLWLDPRQGVPLSEMTALVTRTLLEAGVAPQQAPDLLLVPDDLGLAGIARLYAAVDVVVPDGDAVATARADATGKRVLADLAPWAWREAARSAPRAARPVASQTSRPLGGEARAERHA